MKPGIVNWVYTGLAFILLNLMLGILNQMEAVDFYITGVHFDFHELDDSGGGYIPVLSAIVLIVATVAAFGLVKRTSWARIVTFSIVAFEGLLILVVNGFLLLVLGSIDKPPVLSRQFITSLVVGIPLLFLAYKIYTSEPLKIYLSKPPHTAT